MTPALSASGAGEPFAGHWLSLLGFMAAVIPFATVAHIVAEGLALPDHARNVAFAVRHLYFVPLLAFCAWWFSRTLGLERGRAEMSRRCAMLRARLRGPGGAFRMASLFGANLCFFVTTQAAEGWPMALSPAAMAVMCLCAAALGSFVAAVWIFRIGPSLLAAALAAIAFVLRSETRPCMRRAPRHAWTRHASRPYSLLRPKRPPPHSSSAHDYFLLCRRTYGTKFTTGAGYGTRTRFCFSHVRLFGAAA